MPRTKKDPVQATQVEAKTEVRNEIAVMPIESLDFVATMQIGTLTTNAKLIRDSIKASVDNFSIEKYEGDAKKAAEQKAKLNNLAKKMNDARIAYEREWNKPFAEFKGLVNDSVSLIKGVSGQLDVIVKEIDNKEKEAKKAEISEIWKVYEFNLVPLEKIFNDKWLNKTYKASQIHDDIAQIIDRITGDLQSIEQFGEDTDTLKELYLTTLDLQATLRRGAELRESRKRLAEEEARKAQLEAERQADLMQKASKPEIPQTITTTENTTDSTCNVDFATRKVTAVQPTNPEQPEEQIYTFYVTMPIAEIAKSCGIKSQPILMSATKKQLLNFKSEMEKHGYVYDKLIYENKLLLNVHAKV